MSDYVITGGPCCGKTAVLETIAKKGHVIVPEAARAIINEQQQKPDGILPWTNNYQFQLMTITRQRKNEQEYVDVPRFLDRIASVEGDAYSRFHKNELPQEVHLEINSRRYTEVYLLEQLPRAYYKQDAERKETYEQSCALSQLLHEAYVNAKYTPIVVPAFIRPFGATAEDVQKSVQLRTDFILHHVRTRA